MKFPFTVRAFYDDGSEILGNLDGQGSFPTKMAARRHLQFLRTQLHRYKKASHWELHNAVDQCIYKLERPR